MAQRTGELALIQQIRTRWAAGRPNPAVALGIGDDCALLRPPRNHEIAVTTDFLLETKHFRRDWHPAASVGHRALARGLSDLAAMGARPLSAFLSLALPPDLLAARAGRRWREAGSWIAEFFTGLRSLADRMRTTLAGGDTASSPCNLILADIVLIGAVPRNRALRRSSARPNDLLYVTGHLGGAAAELQRLAQSGRIAQPTAAPELSDPNPHPQLFPEPRLAVGQALVRRKLAHAAIDLSDGLSTDLHHLCRESGLAAELDEAALPIHPLTLAEARTSADALALALNGGEDYELLFSAPASTRMPRRLAGVPITPIGRLLPGTGVTLIAPSGRRRALRPGGWEHLSGKH